MKYERQKISHLQKITTNSDAIFILQRHIDATLASKDDHLSLLFLDWAKAFDRVSAPALVTALRHFGLPDAYLDIIADIYTDRVFTVKDGPHESDLKPQSSGIAQGCPLSPYLFIMMLTVIMEQVEEAVPDDFSKCLDIAYADDTTLISEDPAALQTVFHKLFEIAKDYGLEPNLDKTLVQPEFLVIFTVLLVLIP